MPHPGLKVATNQHFDGRLSGEDKVTPLCMSQGAFAPPPRVRKVTRFSIFLNLELLFCEIFDSKE